MAPNREPFEWEVVQDHYGPRRRLGGYLFMRNLRRPDERGRGYRRQMARIALLFVGCGVGVVAVKLVADLVL
jgi:hypothetical protein